MKTFSEKVLDIVKKIPKGKVMTYKQIAQKTGSPQAARAVGSLMAKNINLDIPCHRVIRSDGIIGTYNGLRGKSKEQLLKKEGVIL
jgi:O-6-methylguanine DNA methyltransferase